MNSFFRIFIVSWLIVGIALPEEKPHLKPEPSPSPSENIQKEMEQVQPPTTVVPDLSSGSLNQKNKIGLLSKAVSGELEADDVLLLASFGFLGFVPVPIAQSIRYIYLDRHDRKAIETTLQEIRELEKQINDPELRNALNELGYSYQVAAKGLEAKSRNFENTFAEYANTIENSGDIGQLKAFRFRFGAFQTKIKEAQDIDSHESWKRFLAYLNDFKKTQDFDHFPPSVKNAIHEFEIDWAKEEAAFRAYEAKVKEMIVPLLLSQEPLLRMRYRMAFPLSNLDIPFYLPEFESTVKSQTNLGYLKKAVKTFTGNEKEKIALRKELEELYPKLFEVRRVDRGRLLFYSPAKNKVEVEIQKSGDGIIGSLNNDLCRTFFQKISDKANVIQQKGFSLRNKVLLASGSAASGLAALYFSSKKTEKNMASGAGDPDLVVLNLQKPMFRHGEMDEEFAKKRDQIREVIPEIQKLAESSLDERVRKVMNLPRESQAIKEKRKEWLLDHIIAVSINDAIKQANIPRPVNAKEVEMLFKGEGKFAGIYHGRFKEAFRKTLIDNTLMMIYQDIYKNIPATPAQRSRLLSLLEKHLNSGMASNIK